MKQRVLFLCLFILGLVCCFSSAHAEVYWDDDFEIPLTQAGRWAYLPSSGCSGSPCPYLDIVSPANVHSGVKSLRLYYDTMPYDDSHNVAIIRTFPHPQTNRTLFTRFYYFTATPFNYPSPPNETNHFYLGDLGVVAVHSGSRAMALKVLNSEDCMSPTIILDCYAPWLATPNREIVNLNDNQWYCIETETTMNTLGNSDAKLSLWVNGILTLDYTKFRIRGTAERGPNGNSSLSGFNSIKILKQDGTGRMHYDQFAVGTTRIGCPETPDAPAAPTNLNVH